MKTKKIFLATLSLAGVIALASCDAKPKNTSIPYGSLSDTTYASAMDGKYTVTEKQVYTKIRSNAYDELTKKIYSIVFKDNINKIISEYKTNTETKKSIDDAIALACFSTSSAKTLKDTEAKTIKTNKEKYVDTMAAIGVKLDVNNLTYDIVDDDNDGRYDRISFNNLNDALISYYAYDLGLKDAAKDYYSSIASSEQIYDYNKEEMVDNGDYIDDDSIKSRYESTYKTYNTTKAIIVRFNSLRDAENAIKKTEAAVGELTNANALQFFTTLYNTYYSYRTPLVIENNKLNDVNSISYLTDRYNSELNNISTNFSTFYNEALVDGGFDTTAVKDGSYTAFPRSIDDKYFMVYKIDTKYFGDESTELEYADLETKLGKDKADELKETLKNDIIDSKASSSVATSTIFKNLLIDGDNDHKADDVLDIKIYDPYYEYRFYNSYANDDYYSYISKKDYNSNLLASVTYKGTTTDISVDEFFNSLASYKGAQIATTYLLNQYMTDTYKDTWLDSDDLDSIKKTFKDGVKSFKKDNTSIPKFLGLENYYTINYGYATEDEIYTQNLYSSRLLAKYSSTYYRDNYFVKTDDSYTINEDVKIFKNMLDYTSEVYKTLFSIDVNHFLISVDDNCDGTIDDPVKFRNSLSEDQQQLFDAEVLKLAKALMYETNYIKTDKLSALKYLVDAFNQGKELVSPEGKALGTTWDDFKYTFNFKLTVEDLGEVTQTSVSNYVEPFANYIKETYNEVKKSDLNFDDDNSYFFLNGLTKADGTTDIASLGMDNLCQTVYGYHVLVVTDFEEPKNAYYPSSNDSSKDYANIKVIVDEKDEDNDDDDIYFVTNAYNESTTNISINQLYIYFYEYLINGSVTSMSSNLRNAISAMASSVISRYTNSTFQTWLELNELGVVTFTNDDNLSFTYNDYIDSLKTTIDGYDEVTTFKGWFDKEWK